MGLIKSLDDERLISKNMEEAQMSIRLYIDSLRAALKERDDYKTGGQAYWDGLVALRAERDAALEREQLCKKVALQEIESGARERDAALSRAEEAERKLCRAREDVPKILKGIDKEETEDEDGWWETSSGAESGEKILKEILAALSSSSPMKEKTDASKD